MDAYYSQMWLSFLSAVSTFFFYHNGMYRWNQQLNIYYSIIALLNLCYSWWISSQPRCKSVQFINSFPSWNNSIIQTRLKVVVYLRWYCARDVTAQAPPSDSIRSHQNSFVVVSAQFQSIINYPISIIARFIQINVKRRNNYSISRYLMGHRKLNSKWPPTATSSAPSSSSANRTTFHRFFPKIYKCIIEITKQRPISIDSNHQYSN